MIESDFSEEERLIFTITREILWQSVTAIDEEVNKKEIEYINRYWSNNPEIWYNRWPKFKVK